MSWLKTFLHHDEMKDTPEVISERRLSFMLDGLVRAIRMQALTV